MTRPDSLAERKGKTGLLGGLGEDLLLDGETADGHCVVGNVALERARAVTDGEVRAVRLVRRRSRGIVLGVEEACDRRALGRRYPEVRGASVQDHLELRRVESALAPDRLRRYPSLPLVAEFQFVH
jgi:hypothetical protein